MPSQKVHNVDPDYSANLGQGVGGGTGTGGGDVSGPGGGGSGGGGSIVTGIQGVPVDPTPPTTGQELVFNGAAWAPASETGPVAIPGVYDANAAPYSCVPNASGHDNRDGITSAIADAVTFAAANNGVAVVEFDSGEYWVNGALQTSIGNAYAQIPLPSVSNTAAKVLLILRPKIGSGMALETGTQTTVQPGVVIFHSNLTGQVYDGTFGCPAILGGPSPKRTSTFNNIQLWLQGIGFRTAANPSLCGADMSLLQNVIFENCRFDTTDTPGGGITQPTHVTGLATLVPIVNNNAVADYRGLNQCIGWYAGLSFNEHTQAEKLYAFQCVVAINATGDYYHAAQLEHVSAEWCNYVFATVDPSAGIVNPSGASGYLTDIEDAVSGWGVPTYHVNDPGNDYYGRIRYIRVLAGTGTVTGALTVNGATHLSMDDLTTIPGGAPPSGAAGGDLGATYPNPTVTGLHVTWSGDLTGSGTSPTVAKINGSPVGTLTPATGDRLRWGGVSWLNSAQVFRPAMVHDPTSGNWLPITTGDGDAVMVES